MDNSIRWTSLFDWQSNNEEIEDVYFYIYIFNLGSIGICSQHFILYRIYCGRPLIGDLTVFA